MASESLSRAQRAPARGAPGRTRAAAPATSPAAPAPPATVRRGPRGKGAKVTVTTTRRPQRGGPPQRKRKDGGNLLLIDDAWVRAERRGAPATAALPVQEVSDARIDVAIGAGGPAAADLSSRAWTVRAPVTFQYRVVEAPGLLDPANDALLFGHLDAREGEAARRRHQRRLVVIDEKVDALYGERVRAYFDARGTEYELLSLPMVEEEKDVSLMLRVCEAMKRFDVDRRNEPVIAIGGGVCLDVVGLAATLFRRKTPYVRVPTTTLSYVDASVGAKTGVNFMGSKNRLGGYVPPAAALLDPAFIVTEDRRAVASGVAEMAKMAIMKSPELFALLEADAARLVRERFQARSAADAVPARVLRLSIETMLEELAPNLNERSLDRLVDFGHTIGQELEMHALGTEHELTHGESVAVDMAYSAALSCVLGHIDAAQRDRIIALLASAGLPLYSPIVDRAFIEHAISERVKQSMGQRLPLPTGIGRGNLFNDVSMREFYRAHEEWVSLVGPGGAAARRPAAARDLGGGLGGGAGGLGGGDFAFGV